MKKVSLVFMFIFSMVIGMMAIEAESITFNDVVNKMKFLHEEFVITSTDSSVTITTSGIGPERKSVFNYKDGIISYAYEGTTSDELGWWNVSMDNTCMFYLIEAIGVLHGYTEPQMKTWYKKVEEDYINYTLAKDGIEFTIDTFNYDFAGMTGPVDLFVTSKVDINNIKIETLGDTDIIPKVEITKVTDKELWIKSLVKTSDDLECDVFISTNNVDYKLIGTIACSNDTTTLEFSVADLSPNTTYYFKSAVNGYNNFSEVVKVTTLATAPKNNQATQDKNSQEIPNPDTSDINIVLVILTINISSFVGYYAYRKKKMI